MCRLRNIVRCVEQECLTTGQTDRRTDAGQSDPFESLCLAGDTKSGSATKSFSTKFSFSLFNIHFTFVRLIQEPLFSIASSLCVYLVRE